MVRVISAYTTYPNTPESDLQRTVQHTVMIEIDGKRGEIQLLAECPITAMDRVRNMPEQLVKVRSGMVD